MNLQEAVSNSLNDLVKAKADFIFAGTPDELLTMLRRPVGAEHWPATGEALLAVLGTAKVAGFNLDTSDGIAIWRAHADRSPEAVGELARLHQMREARGGKHLTISEAVASVRQQLGIAD